MKPKVVITDNVFEDFEPERSILEAGGCGVVEAQSKTEADVIAATNDADCVIAMFAPVTAKTIEAMAKAKAIIRNGIGYDNIDVEAARRRGIPVCNIPDYCIDEVADHTLGLILALTRQLMPNTDVFRDGNWALAVEPERMLTLKRLTVGIIGLGRIGRAVAERLRPFKCRMLVFDPAVDNETVRTFGGEPVALDQLYAEADIVSLHCACNDATRKMINADSLAKMKRTALLVNVGRGGLVDGGALCEALHAGRLAGAALDVTDPEPLPRDHPLRNAPNLIITCHIASWDAAGMRAMRERCARMALQAVRGEPLPNIVNGVVPGVEKGA